jgi:uncharacterized membrane protein
VNHIAEVLQSMCKKLGHAQKWPIDLMHDKFCPCGHFNYTKTEAEFETQQHASTNYNRPSHQGGGPGFGCDAL